MLQYLILVCSDSICFVGFDKLIINKKWGNEQKNEMIYTQTVKQVYDDNHSTLFKQSKKQYFYYQLSREFTTNPLEAELFLRYYSNFT